MMELLEFEFMRNAILAGVLASVICGIIGSLVVVNRIVFLAGGIAHAAYGGIGMALYFGMPFMVGTLGFALMAAMIMAVTTLKFKHRSDTIIGVIWAVGMAFGVICVDLTPGYHVDLMSYLFGSILAVPRSDLWVMLGASAVIFAIVAFNYNCFLAISYDDEYARLRGVPVMFFHFLLTAMIAVAVVMVIRVVGLILVIALLTIPTFIAERYARSLWQMMIMATGFSVVFTLTGLGLSYYLDLTSGAMIILVCAAGFFVSLGIDLILDRLRVSSVNQLKPKTEGDHHVSSV